VKQAVFNGLRLLPRVIITIVCFDIELL